MYVCMCVCGELFANFTDKDHRHAHQLGGVTLLMATYLSEYEASYLN